MPNLESNCIGGSTGKGGSDDEEEEAIFSIGEVDDLPPGGDGSIDGGIKGG